MVDVVVYGVWVVNLFDYGVGEVVIYVLVMVLDLICNIIVYDCVVKVGEWYYIMVGIILCVFDFIIGIIGLGCIGKCMVYILCNFFKCVIVYDFYIIDGDFFVYVECVSCEELFCQVYVVLLYMFLNDEMCNMIDVLLFNLLQLQSYLVNFVCGGFIKIDDLLVVLESGQLKGVVLDVLLVELLQMVLVIVQYLCVLLLLYVVFFLDVVVCELWCKVVQNLIDWDCNGWFFYVVVQGKNK